MFKGKIRLSYVLATNDMDHLLCIERENLHNHLMYEL